MAEKKVRRDKIGAARSELQRSIEDSKDAVDHANAGRCKSAISAINRAAIHWAYGSAVSYGSKSDSLGMLAVEAHEEKGDAIEHVAKACLTPNKLGGVSRRRRSRR
jgi:hypothetical protein